MSRLTGTDVLGLFEAYQAVYVPQELTEEQVWEEVDTWVNSLVEEGYDLSDYTWEEMYESYIEEQGAVNWDTGKTASGVSPRNKSATRQAQLSSSPNPQDRTRAAQIDTIRGNMRASIQATGTSSMNKLQSAGPVASQRFKNAAIRQRGGSPASVPVRTVPGLKPANQAAQARRGGGGSSAQGLGSAGSPSGSTGRFQVGGGQGYGGAGVKLANSYEYDNFDAIFEHLIAQGYANTQESALVIMANMSEEWRQSIIEMDDFSAGGGNAKMKKTGMDKASVEALGKKNLARLAAKKSPTPSATPKPAAAQSKPQQQRTIDVISPGFTSRDKDGYRAPTAAARFHTYTNSKNAADDVASWNKLNPNDPEVQATKKKWADTHYRQNMAIATNDPNYDPSKTAYPQFKRPKSNPRDSWDKL